MNHSDDQRLQFHLQLMGRLPSRTEPSAEPDLNAPLHRQSTAPNRRFIDPLDALTADPSPYHHAMLTQPSSASTRPSSRASAHSASVPPVPLPFYSPSSSLSSRHSTSPHVSVYATPFLLPPRPSSAQSAPAFDPDFEAERVRWTKLEQRRSMGLGANRPNMNSSRASSASSIASVRSFRSARPSRSKAVAASSVYRPSPLRSTSTPDLGVVETEADKKKHRKEMKEEYDKMRAALIEEEKRLQREREKLSPHPSHQSWFTSRFKRSTKTAPPPQQDAPSEALEERRSTSQLSATDSTAHSSSALDHTSHSAGTVPTSEEASFQAIGETQKNDEMLENSSEQTSPFDSPAIDPFRKSMLPGQVPPTPTKLTLISSATPKSMRILTPARTNLHKLNRLFDTLKLGGSTHPENHDHHSKRKTQISVVEPNTPAPRARPDQSGWLGSFKSIPSKSRSSRRKTLVGMFLPEKDTPPPVPKLPDHLS